MRSTEGIVSQYAVGRGIQVSIREVASAVRYTVD